MISGSRNCPDIPLKWTKSGRRPPLLSTNQSGCCLTAHGRQAVGPAAAAGERQRADGKDEVVKSGAQVKSRHHFDKTLLFTLCRSVLCSLAHLTGPAGPSCTVWGFHFRRTVRLQPEVRAGHERLAAILGIVHHRPDQQIGCPAQDPGLSRSTYSVMTAFSL